MSIMPPLGSFAEIMYDELEPTTYDEEYHNYSLAWYIKGIGTMLDEINDLARETDTRPGWGLLFDADNVPVEFLPWLGQFSGTEVDVNLDEAGQRILVKAQTGDKRGRPTTIAAVAQAYLGGSRTVIIRERTPDAYSYEVIVRTADVTDETALRAALAAAKPASLVYTLIISDAFTYAELAGTYSDYSAVGIAFLHYSGITGG